jgi:hypothetical protein
MFISFLWRDSIADGRPIILQESAYIAFRMSDSASMPQQAAAMGRRSDVAPQHALLRGLATRCPKLDTLVTHMPSVWSPLLLNFATPLADSEQQQQEECSSPSFIAPADRKIVLLPGAGPAVPTISGLKGRSGMATMPISTSSMRAYAVPQFPALSLYLRGASKHPELMRMIALGSSSVMSSGPSTRGRAHTWVGGERAPEDQQAVPAASKSK